MKISEPNSNIGARGKFVRAVKVVLFSLSFGFLASCQTTGAQILDKEKGWIQISKGRHIDVYFCDATQKWPTCKVPEYIRLD